MSYKYIYHISDIHIKSDQDPNIIPLENAFNQVIKHIEYPSESLIVITGDLFHSKNNISYASMNFLIEILKKLSIVSKVILILGNHDISPMNEDGDLKTLIIDLFSKTDLNNKVHLITNENVHIFKNLVFVHTKFYSDKIKTIKDPNHPKLKDKIKIALFHNEINGVKMANNIESSYKIHKKDFKQFDLVLLGHIHKCHFLKNNMAYAGSLIQQNFGEEINNQGFIKWTLNHNNITGEFIKIHQDTQYITIDTNNYIDYNYPKYSKIRLIYNTTYSNDIKEYIKTKTEIISFTPIREIKYKKENQTEDYERFHIKSNDDVINLIMKYINKKYTKEESANVLKVLKNILEDINYNYNISPKEYHLNKLKFNNTMTYGSNNYINFSNLNGIIGLVAPNYYGKSSIIDILLYSMFEKSHRGLPKDIININKITCSTECNFSIKENNKWETYNIIKQGKKKDNLIVSTQIEKNGNIIVENKQNLKNYIETNICDKDNFLRSSIVVQKDNGFLDLSPKDKRDIIFSLYNLNIFDDIMRKIHKLKTNSTVIMKDRIKRRDYFIKMNNGIDDNNKDYNKLINKVNKKIESLRNEKNIIKDKMSKYTNNENIDLDYEVNEAVYNQNKILLNVAKEGIEDCNKKIDNYNKELINKQNWLIENNGCKSLIIDDIEYNNIKDIINKIMEYQKYKDIKDFINDIVENRKDYYNDIIKDIKHIDIIEKYIYTLNIDEDIKKIKDEIKIIKQNIDNENNNIRRFKYDINKCEKEIKWFENKSYLTIKKEYDSIKEQITELKRKIIHYEDMKRKLKSLEELNNEIKNIEEESVNIKLLECIVSDQDELKNIINDVIKDIEDQINDLLNDMAGFKIKLDYDIRGGVYVYRIINTNNSNKLISASQMSGFEKEVVNIIFKVILNRMNTEFKTDFMIIDEGFTSYDGEHLKGVKVLFDMLRKNYKFILIISHIDVLKEYFDNVIEVGKEDGLSWVRV